MTVPVKCKIEGCDARAGRDPLCPGHWALVPAARKDGLRGYKRGSHNYRAILKQVIESITKTSRSMSA